MRQHHSARWLLPALLLSVIPMFSYAEVIKSVGIAPHMLLAYGEPQADATPAAQPQTPAKTPANRKHLNVSVGPVRMHLPVSGKRPVAAAAPSNSNSATGTPELVHPVQQPLGTPSLRQEPLANGNAPNSGGGPADVRIETTNTGAQKARATQGLQTPAPGSAPQPAGLSTAATPGIAAGSEGGRPLIGNGANGVRVEADRTAQTQTGVGGKSGSENLPILTQPQNGSEERAYQPPQGIDPASTNVEAVTVVNNGAPGSPSNIEAAHIEQPITFRWTPVIPVPKGQVTYRMSVWQLTQGQTGAQAMKANQPIITKDVDNITELEVSKLPASGCGPQNACGFIWNVQALDRKGRFIKGYNDNRRVGAFRVDAQSGGLLEQQPGGGSGGGQPRFAAGTYTSCCGLAVSEVETEGIYDRWGSPALAQKPTPGGSGKGVPAQSDVGIASGGVHKQADTKIQNPVLDGHSIKANTPILEQSGVTTRKSSGTPPIEGMKANQPILTKDVDEQPAASGSGSANGGTGGANSLSSHGGVAAGVKVGWQFDKTAPGAGSGKPQPADNVITAINITLPANPDAANKVNGAANGGTGGANSISDLSHDDARGTTGLRKAGGSSTQEQNKVKGGRPVKVTGSLVPNATPVSPASVGNGNQPTQQPGVVRGNIFQDGGEATRTSSAGKYVTAPDTCNGQALAAGATCTLVTANPNGKPAQTFTVTNTGGQTSSALDTRPPKVQPPGQERDVINKGLPITNKNIVRTEPNVVKDATDRGPVNQLNTPAPLSQNGKPAQTFTVTNTGGQPTGTESAKPAKHSRFSLSVGGVQVGIGSSTRKPPQPATTPANGAPATGKMPGNAAPSQSPGTNQGKYPPATPTQSPVTQNPYPGQLQQPAVTPTTGNVVPGQTPVQYPPVTPEPAPAPRYAPYNKVVVNGRLRVNPSVLPAQPDCDEAAVMNGNQVVLPAGADPVTPPEDVDEDQGTLASLYPGVDTTTDAMYPLPCTAPIGGTLPEEANANPSPDEEAAQQYVDNFETTTGTTLAQGRGQTINKPSLMNDFTVGPCYISTSGTNSQQVPCNSPQYLLDNEPFEGRDIIYVHGLAMGQLTKWLTNYAPAHKLWPEDASEFIGATGYFRLYANEYWHDHIQENLFDPYNSLNPYAGYEWTAHDAGPVYVPKSNRYLTVAWSSNQTLDFAQDAFMVQVMLAMTQGTNVVTPSTYPKQFNKPFCANGCIIISHSTGGEIVASSMGLASQGHFGPAGVTIMKHMRAHVALESATSGSRLASIAFLLGTMGGGPSLAVQTILCGIEDDLWGMTGACSLDTSFVQNSILLDLIPMVAQKTWGPAINASPIPTVTVAGGHTVGNHHALTGPFLPGLDDGVVSMNSACGNPARVYPPTSAPSGITVTSWVADFDMGQNLARAVKYFLAQRNLRAPGPTPNFMAGGCTPWLSTMGMVLPVQDAWSGSFWDTRQRYNNYFSFIQGSIDHSHDGGSDTANKWPSVMNMTASTPRRYLSSFGAANNEEMSVVTNPGIYQRDSDGVYLVNPAFAGQMHQFQRGRKLKFRLLGHTHTWWIWRRTYMLLNNYQDKSSANYVYEYVERR